MLQRVTRLIGHTIAKPRARQDMMCNRNVTDKRHGDRGKQLWARACQALHDLKAVTLRRRAREAGARQIGVGQHGFRQCAELRVELFLVCGRTNDGPTDRPTDRPRAPTCGRRNKKKYKEWESAVMRRTGLANAKTPRGNMQVHSRI